MNNTYLKITIFLIWLIIAIASWFIFPNSAHADQGDWTMHLVSTHPGQSGLNNINPGIAYNVTDDIRIGAVRNSYKRLSLYVMEVYSVTDRLRIGAGAASGYEAEFGSPIIPVVAVEYDITDSFSVVWFGLAFNLEWRI